MKTVEHNLVSLLDMAGWGVPRWLSGERQAPLRTVNWVSTDPATAGEGDLLVVLAHQLTPEDAELVISQGVAAILILGKVVDLDQLQLSGLPVANLEALTDLRAVQEKLLTLLIDQRIQLMELSVSIYAQLSQLEAEGAGISGLVRRMMEISGQSVVLQDKRLNVLASSPTTALQAVWDELLEYLSLLDNLPRPLRDRKQAGQQALVLVQHLPGGLARVVSPVQVGGVARGYLSLVGEEEELDATDQVVVEKGADVCAIDMARSKAIRETEKRLHSDLLAALLQGHLEARDARLWAHAMGFDLTQSHVALRFAWDTPAPPSRRRLETLVNGEVHNANVQAIVHPMGSEVIVFQQIHPGTNPPLPAIQLGQRVLERALEENQDAPVRCGVGSPAADLNSWRVSFRQAGQALDMSRRLVEERPLYFPDLSVYRLLLQLEHHPELPTFQEEILGALLDYETGDELIRTLATYFKHNANLSQTADALFIHRNTLLYRMERIAEITGLDLDNPETRLALQLALHIHQMLGGAPQRR